MPEDTPNYSQNNYWKVRLLAALKDLSAVEQYDARWAVGLFEALDETGWQPEIEPEPEPEPEPAPPPPQKKKRGRKKRPRPQNCHGVPGIELLALDPCAYCGNPIAKTHDHIDPLSRGGTHELENLVRCCKDCNFEKGVRSLALFLAYRAVKARVFRDQAA